MSKNLTQMCVDVIAEKDKQIAELETQLISECKEYQEAMKLADNVIKDLEAKLEVSKKAIVDLTNTCDEWSDKYIKLQDQLAIIGGALELAVDELDDAKDMLRACGKHDWAGMLDTSADYFKARAKEMKDV